MVNEQLLTRAHHYIEINRTVDTLMRFLVNSFASADVELDEIFDTAKLREQLRGMVVKVVAETYTIAELDAVIAFASSETGRSIAAKQLEVEARVRAATPAILDSCM